MSLKKELKKLEKSYKATKKKFAKNVKRYLKKQKLTKGDAVFGVTLVLIFLVTMGMVDSFSLELTNVSKLGSDSTETHIVSETRAPNPTLRAIVFGVKSTEAKGVTVAAAPKPDEINLPILMYHRIDNKLITGDKYAAGLTVSTANFEAQLNYLKSQGYSTLSFDDLYKSFYAGETLPPKSVILTFDDGYEDNYQYAFPLLQKYGLKGTFFVATGFTDTNPFYMTREQIREMSDAGMNIESHTVSHPDLTKLSHDQLVYELNHSRQALQDIIGKDIFFFAYPFGTYNQAVATETKNVGYLMSVTTKVGKTQKANDPFGLVRFRVGPATTITSFANLIR